MMKYPMNRSEVNDIVNEMCLHCGKYKTEYLGSCTDCPGLDVKWGEEDGKEDGADDQ